MLTVGAAVLLLAGCSSEDPTGDPPAAADEVDEVPADDDASDGDAAAGDAGADDAGEDGSADGASDGGAGGGGYGLVDEVCATFDHDHFVEVHGIAATVVADDVTSLGGHTDYLYCELDAGNHAGPDGQTLSVAIFFHPSPDIARGAFEGAMEGLASVEPVIGPWQEGALTSTVVTGGGRFTAGLHVIDGTLEVSVDARTLEPFTTAGWAEPLERIVLEILASLRTG